MKNFKKVLGSLLVVGFMTMNFVSGNNNSGVEGSSFSLKNLNALVASAGEAYCDPINENQCVLWLYNNGVLVGSVSSKGRETVNTD